MKLASIISLFRKSLSNPKRRRDVRTFSQGLANTEMFENRVLLSTTDGNDQLSEATSLGGMNVARGWSGVAVDFATDVDMYSFTVQAGQRIAFDIDRSSGSGLDSYIRLFNGSGAQLAFSDDAAAPGEVLGRDSYLEYTFSAGGTYFIGVSGYGNSSYSPTLGTGDSNGSTGAYALYLTPVDTNDQMSEAYNLGSITTSRSVTGFSIEDTADVDMFRFTVTAGQRLSFDIDRPSGSLDSYIRLFNSSGAQIAFNDDGPTPGEASSRESYLSFTFTTAGTYYLGVSSFGNAGYNPSTGAGDSYGTTTGAFTLNITPATTTTPGRNTLYVNFDGSTITNAQLRSWAGTDWAGSITSYLDTQGDGIRVNRFLDGRADRDAVISGIMTRLQADLRPYGITVQRVTGMGATGVGATTLFFGNHNMGGSAGHIACDVDYNNNNQTDIAFIQDENWGTTDRTATALADVALHEAGHTFGLFHVNTVQSGVIYNESMGLRYSTAQSEWVRDTSFMDRTFTEYLNHGGGRGSQNAHRVMLANFGLSSLSVPKVEARLSADALRAVFFSDVCSGHDHGDDDHDDHDDDDHGPGTNDARRGQFFGIAGLMKGSRAASVGFVGVARQNSLDNLVA